MTQDRLISVCSPELATILDLIAAFTCRHLLFNSYVNMALTSTRSSIKVGLNSSSLPWITFKSRL